MNLGPYTARNGHAIIYLDNGATTYPKPNQVTAAVDYAMCRLGANPGRGGYKMSVQASECLYACRKEAASLFHTDGPEYVVFMPSCTQAVNTVIKGLLSRGDHVVVSDLEHNAVMRPLQKLAQSSGVTFTVAKTFPGNDDMTVASFRGAMTANTKLVACIHASNVFGMRLPVERIAALAHMNGAEICVDAAQSAGILPIDMIESGIDYLCVPGHKGLYGPMGTGMLILRKGNRVDTLVEGGTGVQSRMPFQPEEPPERYESGTQNIPGIAGLCAGIRMVRKTGIQRIYRHEMSLVSYINRAFSNMPQIETYTGSHEAPYYVPVLSFNVKGMNSQKVGDYLARQNIAVRCGLHCAPAAHDKMGTTEGTVRVVPSIFTNQNEINFLIQKMKAFK